MGSSVKKAFRLACSGISYGLGTPAPLAPPLVVHIEPTNRCNYKCSFCFHSDPRRRKARPFGFLPLDNFRRLVDQVDALDPVRRYLALTLGGEPLLHKDLPDFVRIANERGFAVGFASNGRLLTPDMTDRLVEAGGFDVMIDFSSVPEVFEKHRGGEGDYDLVLENLRYVVSAFVSRPKTHGLAIVDMTSVDETFRDASLENMRSLFPPNPPANIYFHRMVFHNACGFLGTDVRKERYRLCPYPWSQIVVAWNGDVLACCRDIEGKTVLGNVFESSLADVWRGEKYAQMRRHLARRRPQRNAACAHCDMPWSGGEKRWRLRYLLSRAGLMRIERE